MESVQALAKEFGDFSHDVQAAWQSLNAFGGDATALSWIGQTAEAFKTNFGPLPGRLQKLSISYSEASDALSAYWPKLQAAQGQADAALRQGHDADADLTRATGTATTAAATLKTAQAGPDPKAAADAQSAHNAAQKNLNDAKGRLAALGASAQQAHDDLIAAAKECAKALHHASHDGIHNKHWWQHVGETLSHLGGLIADYAAQIAQIAAVLAPILNGIALLTVEIPGLDVLTASLAAADDFLAATAPEVATAGLAIKATGDGLQGHWKDLGMDALYLGASRMGGKGKGGEEGSEGPPPGAMAAHDGDSAAAEAGGTAPDLVTPSRDADPDAVPGGRRTVIDPNNDADTIRSLTRENESADTAAKAGFDVEQNPAVPGNKNPDYKIEGEVFDNYAPKTGSTRNIWSTIQGKVESGQADRITLNLDDSSVDRAALAKQLQDWPIPGLKQVIKIENGTTEHLYP